VFDVDGCLIDLVTGTSLRPLAVELFESLTGQGVDVVLWSAGGAAYAARRASQVGIDTLVAACHGKTERDPDGRWRIDHLLERHRPAVFVDDQPEDLPGHLVVLGVSPYIAHSPHDRGLSAALSAARGDCCPS
jgi:hypothetical protein